MSETIDALTKNVIVGDGEVAIVDLKILSDEVSRYFDGIPANAREEEMKRCIEIGVRCLERARVTQDIDFVQKELAQLLNNVKKEVGEMPDATVEELSRLLGTEDGQVLKPIADQVKIARDTITTRLTEVENLIENDLDASNSESALGGALDGIRKMLDEENINSVQFKIKNLIEDIAADDGLISKAIETKIGELFEDQLAPVESKLEELKDLFSKQKGAEEIVDQTTLKGSKFEEYVVALMQPWCKAMGTHPDYVGPENKPGDVVVEFSDDSPASVNLKLVVSIKDHSSGWGQTPITEDADSAMMFRAAHSAIVLGKTPEAFSKGVGTWAEGSGKQGPWIACTIDHLMTALRLAIVKQQISQMRSLKKEVDADQISSQVTAIRTSLQKITTMKSAITKSKGHLNDLEGLSDDLKSDISTYLDAIEDALGPAPSQEPDPWK